MSNDFNENEMYDTPEQTPPSADMKGLDRLVGTWRVSGEAEGEVTYEWMEGGHFLIQRVALTEGRGIEIIGHEQRYMEPPSAEIKSRFYGNDGATLDYVYEMDGDTLIIWFGEKGSPAYYKGTFSDDGNTLTGGWVYPNGGGYQVTSTRTR